MNWIIWGLECVLTVILFTSTIMIPLCHDPAWWIHDYPKDIQDKAICLGLYSGHYGEWLLRLISRKEKDK